MDNERPWERNQNYGHQRLPLLYKANHLCPVHPPKIDSKPCECFYLNSKLQPMGRWYHAACDSLGVKENYGQLNGSLVIKEYYGQQMAAWL
jgi:hypothetical protein